MEILRPGGVHHTGKSQMTLTGSKSGVYGRKRRVLQHLVRWHLLGSYHYIIISGDALNYWTWNEMYALLAYMSTELISSVTVFPLALLSFQLCLHLNLVWNDPRSLLNQSVMICVLQWNAETGSTS